MRTLCTFLILLLLFISSCTSMDAMRNQNRKSLKHLTPGMTKDKVLSVMVWTAQGDTVINPYRTEFYRNDEHTFEILFYYTDRKSADGAITDDELTPLVLIDGKLDGWGWTYWNSLVQKYEIHAR